MAHPKNKIKLPDLRKVILNIHLYGALLCAPYLLIFGISSLNFNHHFDFAKPSQEKITWETSLARVPLGTDHQTRADLLRDSLGMLGWAPYWELRPGENGDLRFGVEHPGRSYKIQLHAAERKASVEEIKKGFWPVVNSLHGLNQLPNSRLAYFWGYYTKFCAWMIISAAFSGIYLWASSNRERKAGTIVVLGAAAVSLAFMAFIVWKG